MKIFKNSSIGSIILLFLLGSCGFPGTINTKEQTIRALIGKWLHKDLTKTDVKSIEFTSTKNKNGDSILIMEYQKRDLNGKTFDDGVWHYKGVGRVEISDIYKNYTLPLSFVNNNTLELEYGDFYFKK
jgi:hypothetical protein